MNYDDDDDDDNNNNNNNKKTTTTTTTVYSKCLLRLVVSRVWCFSMFCTGQFIMVP